MSPIDENLRIWNSMMRDFSLLQTYSIGTNITKIVRKLTELEFQVFYFFCEEEFVMAVNQFTHFQFLLKGLNCLHCFLQFFNECRIVVCKSRWRRIFCWKAYLERWDRHHSKSSGRNSFFEVFTFVSALILCDASASGAHFKVLIKLDWNNNTHTFFNFPRYEILQFMKFLSMRILRIPIKILLY